VRMPWPIPAAPAATRPSDGSVASLRGTTVSSTGLPPRLAVAFGFWLFLQTRVLEKGWRWLTVLTLLAGLVATLARGPWVGAMAMFLVYLAVGPNGFSRTIKATALLAIVFGIALVSPIGGKITLAIGGKGSPLDPGPVSLDVELVSRSDGVFELEDKHSHLVGALGKIIHMGPSAVVRHRGLTILLTSKKLPPFDLGQWRSQGVNPEELSMIGIKAAVGHRVAYGKIAADEFTVNTSGPCTSDLTRLPYTKLRRPVFPLDRLEV